MRRLTVVIPLLLELAAPTWASGQELNLANTSTNRPNLVEANLGMDHAFTAEIGYRRVLAWKGQQIFVGGDFAVPCASPDIFDHRLRVTVGVPIGFEHWKLVGWFSPTLRGSENAGGQMEALGIDLRLAGGYHARRWFAALELGFDWVATTHIAFSDEYRGRVYADARDGWYSSPGGTFYLGAYGGVSFSSFDLVMRTGHPRSSGFDFQSLPFYLTLGANVALPW